MALEITMLRGQMAGGALVADRRLFLAADRLTVVEADDLRAAFLLCGVGSEITGAEAQRLRLSLVGGCVVQDAPLKEKVEEVKEAAKPEDKQAARPKENKAKGGR